MYTEKRKGCLNVIVKRIDIHLNNRRATVHRLLVEIHPEDDAPSFFGRIFNVATKQRLEGEAYLAAAGMLRTMYFPGSDFFGEDKGITFEDLNPEVRVSL